MSFTAVRVINHLQRLCDTLRRFPAEGELVESTSSLIAELKYRMPLFTAPAQLGRTGMAVARHSAKECAICARHDRIIAGYMKYIGFSDQNRHVIDHTRHHVRKAQMESRITADGREYKALYLDGEFVEVNDYLVGSDAEGLYRYTSEAFAEHFLEVLSLSPDQTKAG